MIVLNKTKETQDHWLDLVAEDQSYSAFVKWDGCFEITRYVNGAVPGDNDYENHYSIHFCDIDETIELLQAIKAEALKHFGSNWQE